MTLSGIIYTFRELTRELTNEISWILCQNAKTFSFLCPIFNFYDFFANCEPGISCNIITQRQNSFVSIMEDVIEWEK